MRMVNTGAEEPDAGNPHVRTSGSVQGVPMGISTAITIVDILTDEDT